jgi:hypothetical protein
MLHQPPGLACGISLMSGVLQIYIIRDTELKHESKVCTYVGLTAPSTEKFIQIPTCSLHVPSSRTSYVHTHTHNMD